MISWKFGFDPFYSFPRNWYSCQNIQEMNIIAVMNTAWIVQLSLCIFLPSSSPSLWLIDISKKRQIFQTVGFDLQCQWRKYSTLFSVLHNFFCPKYLFLKLFFVLTNVTFFSSWQTSLFFRPACTIFFSHVTKDILLHSK